MVAFTNWTGGNEALKAIVNRRSGGARFRFFLLLKKSPYVVNGGKRGA